MKIIKIEQTLNISLAEEQILKLLYNNRYNYIARDKNNRLDAHSFKPSKMEEYGIWQNSELNCYELKSQLFPFIKYEDIEPFSISEVLNKLNEV